MQQKRTTCAIGALVLQEFHKVIQTDVFAIPEIFGDHPKFLSIYIYIYDNWQKRYNIIDKIISNNNNIT